MNLIKSTPGFETITSIEYQPTISIVMPFSPISSFKEDLESRMNFITGRVESMLIDEYPAQKAMAILYKLKSLFKGLNYYTHKKSVAIFLSPLIERILYLDFEMEEHISIDPAYRIKDIANLRKNEKEYLVLLLSENFSKMYLGKANELKLIKSNTLVDTDNLGDSTKSGGSPSFPGLQSGIKLDKFIHQMDVGLAIMLKSYPLPVFVVGPAYLVGQYRNITRNEEYIVEYVPGNFEVTSGCDLLFTVKNYLNDWKLIQNRFLLKQLEGGKTKNKLFYGLKNVWRAAFKNNPRLLVLEKDFSGSLDKEEFPEIVQNTGSKLNSLFFIKDEVDELVDRVYDNGGEVYLMDRGDLRQYDQIALIQV
jgi:Bacterial archaeo-eukaryotic release factor family 3